MVKKMMKKKTSSGERLIKIAIRKPGELSRQLGIVNKDRIPMTLLNKINAAKPGEVIINPTQIGKKKIKITKPLKQRANLAKTLKKLPRKGKGLSRVQRKVRR